MNLRDFIWQLAAQFVKIMESVIRRNFRRLRKKRPWYDKDVETFPLLDLPDEIILHIMKKNLTHRELLRLSSTCKRIRGIYFDTLIVTRNANPFVLSRCRNLKQLQFNANVSFPEDLDIVCTPKYVSYKYTDHWVDFSSKPDYINVSFIPIWEAEMAYTSILPTTVQSLAIIARVISNDSFQVLRRLTKLEVLTLVGPTITDHFTDLMFTNEPLFPNLLRLQATIAGPIFHLHFAKLTELDLQFQQLPRKDRLKEWLESMPTLQALELELSFSQIDAYAYGFTLDYSKFRNLTVLSINSCIPGELSCIAMQTKLTELNIDFQITDDIQVLSNLTNLEHLSLPMVHVTIPYLPKLSSLAIQGGIMLSPKIHSALTSLTSISIEFGCIPSLERFSNCKNLKHFKGGLEYSGVPSLDWFPNLKDISLSHLLVSKPLFETKALKNLKTCMITFIESKLIDQLVFECYKLTHLEIMVNISQQELDALARLPYLNSLFVSDIESSKIVHNFEYGENGEHSLQVSNDPQRTIHLDVFQCLRNFKTLKITETNLKRNCFAFQTYTTPRVFCVTVPGVEEDERFFVPKTMLS